ncbi:dienelactone hydrolase family protein [Kocuria aegyptia]|uniref:Dienelactone hydrolase domain-containing protein n=1 Tax=Kocuria aegyptia TaxID=330943 RepID=A0ABN2KJ96_9MICC
MVDEDVQIPAGGTVLKGRLHLPAVNAGVVIMADGGGHGDARRLRLEEVASMLQQAALGTLVVDLLTSQEEPVRGRAGGIDPLAQRLTAAAAWLHQQPKSMSSRVGYCGTGVGAASALWSAGEPGARIEAIVSLGGSIEAAAPRLAAVQAPTLLIVGGEDREGLGPHRRAQAQLRGENRLAVVEGAGELFEEPGAGEVAAGLARDWFTRYLAPAQGRTTEVSR